MLVPQTTLISGFATPAGTKRFQARFASLPAAHFRCRLGLTLSSIGLGTFPGDDDEATDTSYCAAIARALDLGCNVIDTAVPYRYQQSERVIGRTVESLIAAGRILRDELLISTKAGYIPFDSACSGEIRRYFEETFIRPRILSSADVAGGRHCLTPEFLRHQIETSRRNLRCATIDIYFLHDPEQQLRYISRKEFYGRILAAFEVLEQAVADEKVILYGTATWSGYRVGTESKDYLSLKAIMRCAREVGGDDHHFRAIMLPLNLVLPEAFALHNQIVESKNEPIPLLQAAQEFGLITMISSSLHQGRLACNLPIRAQTFLHGVGMTNAQRALQFARSASGVTTALVGARNPVHVEENMALATIPPLSASTFAEVCHSHIQEIQARRLAN